MAKNLMVESRDGTFLATLHSQSLKVVQYYIDNGGSALGLRANPKRLDFTEYEKQQSNSKIRGISLALRSS